MKFIKLKFLLFQFFNFSNFSIFLGRPQKCVRTQYELWIPNLNQQINVYCTVEYFQIISYQLLTLQVGPTFMYIAVRAWKCQE